MRPVSGFVDLSAAAAEVALRLGVTLDEKDDDDLERVVHGIPFIVDSAILTTQGCSFQIALDEQGAFQVSVPRKVDAEDKKTFVMRTR